MAVRCCEKFIELLLDGQESVKRLMEEWFDICPNTHLPIGYMVEGAE